MYRRFIAGVFVGNLGSWMQLTAQGWLVLSLTDSPGALGLAGAAATMPILFLSVFAGVLADRIDRRRLLMTTQLTAALLATILAVLTVTGTVEFWHVVVLAAGAERDGRTVEECRSGPDCEPIRRPLAYPQAVVDAAPVDDTVA